MSKIVKVNNVFEALEYLEDIAYGREMNLDKHELKIIIAKHLNALESIVKSVPLIYLLSGMLWSQVSKEEIENIENIYKELGKEESNGR